MTSIFCLGHVIYDCPLALGPTTTTNGQWKSCSWNQSLKLLNISNGNTSWSVAARWTNASTAAASLATLGLEGRACSQHQKHQGDRKWTWNSSTSTEMYSQTFLMRHAEASGLASSSVTKRSKTLPGWRWSYTAFLPHKTFSSDILHNNSFGKEVQYPKYWMNPLRVIPNRKQDGSPPQYNHMSQRAWTFAANTNEKEERVGGCLW